jgi:NADP-dependent aldehyde dehydrogenase
MTKQVFSDGDAIADLVTTVKDAFNRHLTLSVEVRAGVLRALAGALDANRDRLIAIANEETHLGLIRLTGEVARTSFQLQEFADYIEESKHLRNITQEALTTAPPRSRPTLSLTAVPIGPVAVFAASNFPFAFSVLGGDTASALAAGCPVIVKSHPAHPRLSLEVFRIAQSVIFEHGLPPEWISLISDPNVSSGAKLVLQPELAAVSFTGSLQGGKALANLVNLREVPIPFFGELASINPVIVLPHFLIENHADVSYALADSIVQGTGQFCTSPGLILIDTSPQADAFLASLTHRLNQATTHPMLTKAMKSQFDHLIAKTLAVPDLQTLTNPSSVSSKLPNLDSPRPTLQEVNVRTFVAHPQLRDEIFGPYALVVRIDSGLGGFLEALNCVQGSLTATFWANERDVYELREILPIAMQKAGRVLFSGLPTGVAVTEAQHHGGPWPASTRPDSTSVGMRAIERFLRPVALQDAPSWL